MKKLTTLLLTAALGLSAEMLTLQACVEKALKTHPDIRVFMLETKRQRQSVKVQKGAWHPKVSAYAEYDPQRTYVMPQMGSFHTIDEDGWTAGVSVSQKIFDFSKTSHAVTSAQSAYDISRLSLEEAKALMRYRVRVAYVLLLVRQAALQARQKDLEAKKALYAQAKALVRQGLKTKADESRFLSSVRQAEESLAAAQADLAKAKIALEQYIGAPLSKDATFETDILQNPGLSARSIKLDDLLQNNLELKIAQKSEKVSQERYRSKHAERFGSIDAVAEASHFDTLSRYDTTLLGVRYAVPIYTGGILSAQAEQEKIAQMMAAQKKESKRRAVIEEARSLMADLNEAQKRIDARRAQMVSAKETQELIQARYEEGLATYMEVLDAEAVYLDAKLGLLGAYYARAEQLFRLEYLNGK